MFTIFVAYIFYSILTINSFVSAKGNVIQWFESNVVENERQSNASQADSSIYWIHQIYTCYTTAKPLG